MESLSQDPGTVDRTTRTLQIIILAMTIGLVTFLAITVLFITPPGRPGPGVNAAPDANGNANANAEVGGGGTERLPVLSVAAMTFAVTLVPLSLVVPRLVSDASIKRIAASKPALIEPGRDVGPTDDIGRLALLYQTRTILGAAMTEGPAFLALVAYMIERSPVALGLGLFLIVAVAARFPLRGRVEAWLDDALARVQLARQSGSLG